MTFRSIVSEYIPHKLQKLEGTSKKILPKGYLDFLRQLGLFFLAYFAYQTVRGVMDDQSGAMIAFSNGRDIIDIERSLGIFIEPAVNAWSATSHSITDASSFIYLNAQLSVTFLALLFMYLRRNDSFYFVRNMFMISMLIALCGYMIFPTAPPRFFPEWGFSDLVTNVTGVSHQSSNALFNPYAAVPSMHVAFALMIGIPLAKLCRHRWARICWGVYPVLVTFVIVATANHFIIDAVLGALTAGLAAYGAHLLAVRRPQHWAFGVHTSLQTQQ